MDSKRCSCGQHPGCQGLRFFLVVPSSHIIHEGFLSNLSIKDREILTAATAEILLMDDESLFGGVLLRLHQHDVFLLSAHPTNPLLEKLHAEYVCYVCFGLRKHKFLSKLKSFAVHVAFSFIKRFLELREPLFPSQMELPKGEVLIVPWMQYVWQGMPFFQLGLRMHKK